MKSDNKFDKAAAWEQAKIDTIYAHIRGIQSITPPKITGAQENIKFVRGEFSNYTFKFTTNFNLARKNESVAKKLREYGIPAPDSIAVNHNCMAAELYHTIPGRTLHEILSQGNGITKTELQNIYAEILKYFDIMSRIDFSDVQFFEFKTPTDVAREQLAQTNRGLLATLSPAAITLMNIGARHQRGLYHHGITPKNVIISDKGRVAGFIDLDEVSLCMPHYAFGIIAAKAKLNGISPDTLCDMYEKQSGKKLNRALIKSVAQIQNVGRRALWKQTQRIKQY